jgi:hypothetical protein
MPYTPKLMSDDNLKHVIVDYMGVVHSLLITERMAFCFSNQVEKDGQLCWHRFPNTIQLLKKLIGSKFKSVMHQWCEYDSFEHMKDSNE